MNSVAERVDIETLPVYCPECGTRTEADVLDVDNAVEDHNRQHHGGDPVAGVHVVTRNSNVIAPTPDAIIEHLETVKRMARKRRSE